MKQVNLPKPKIERKCNQLAVLILLILCFQETKAQKLGEILASKECSANYGLHISIQIMQHAQRIYYCDSNDISHFFDQEIDNKSEEQQPINTSQIQIEYGKINLPEYLLYKEFTLKDPSCGDPIMIEMLEKNYNECIFCTEYNYCTKIQENTQSNITSFVEIRINQVFVEAFQLLWNCNNPNNQVDVTDTDSYGFEKACQMCNDENCSVCANNYTECLQCNDGYYKKEGVCISLRLDNCTKITQNKVTEDQFNCDLCKEGYYLLEGKCVKECPSDYSTTQTQCLKCQQGTFIQGEICAQCSKFCQKCTGSDHSQCEQCFEGFEKDQTKGCITSDFDLNPSFKPKKFVDPRTNTEKGDFFFFLIYFLIIIYYQHIKECNFSCDECIDSSDLCIKCNPQLNYFIKAGERLKCYNRCPLYFEPNLSNQDPKSKFIECVKSKNYTPDIEAADQIRNEAKSRCLKQQYWDIQTKQCYKCSNNCISCNNDSSCIECEPDYYWNVNRKTCSPCHPSCKKCTGPLSKDCLSCSSSDKLFPNAYGTCQEAVLNPLPQQKILSQNEIYENLSDCKQFLPQSQQQNYSVEFLQKYSTIDSKWESIKMTSTNSCTFQEFQNRYKYFQKNNKSCEDKEISQSTVGKNGDLVAIYSILLSQSKAQISSNEVNPQTLVEYAISNNFCSSSYIFNPTSAFSCSQLQCISQFDSLLYGFSSSVSLKEISIKTVKDIILTTTNQTPLICFQKDQQVNQNSVEEIEQIVNNSQYTLNTASKQYFILYLCGKSQVSDFVQKPLLVQKYLGNGFFEVVNVSNPISSQVEVVSLYGASAEQNSYLKKCDSSLSNSLSSYQVQKVRIVQVLEQDSNTDKSELMFQQYNEKVDTTNTNPTKCSCIVTRDYILANEDQGNQFITVITPQNKLLTKSIDVQSINHILKKQNIDAEIMKANRLSITKIEADLLFKEYIEETVESTKKCYGVNNSTPLCMINVLADLLFSNNLECLFSQEITSIVKKSDFSGLKDFIKKQNWCSLHQERCLKAQQTIKSCI
ncbi:hypothetical protein ABPG72_007334 [Tetrahymena utriculariae]